jgi:hypothetical protein
MSNNKKSKYLVYTDWEVLTENGLLGGSLLHDYLIMTEEEAKEKVELVKSRAEEFKKLFPSLTNDNRTSRYVYIENRSEWWS